MNTFQKTALTLGAIAALVVGGYKLNEYPMQVERQSWQERGVSPRGTRYVVFRIAFKGKNIVGRTVSLTHEDYHFLDGDSNVDVYAVSDVLKKNQKVYVSPQFQDRLISNFSPQFQDRLISNFEVMTSAQQKVLSEGIETLLSEGERKELKRDLETHFLQK